MKRAVWALVILGASAAAVVVFSRHGEPGDTNAGLSGRRAGRSRVPVRLPGDDRGAVARSVAPPAPFDPGRREDTGPASALPASLRETDVDGAVGVDADGRLLVNPETRRLFDYYLSASGEEPPQALRARIVAAIEARLPPAAAAAAVALLDRYMRYREEARALESGGAAEGDVAERLAQIRALRRRVFGAAEAEALFGPEEAHDRVEVERRQVLGDQTLSPAERERRSAALDAALPASAQAAREAALLPQRLRREEAELLAAGGSDAEVQALREELVGAEAAARLAELDAQRARWRERVDEYRRARDAIERDASLSSEERAGAVAALLAERFTEPERMRVKAVDRLAAAPTPILPGLSADPVLGSGAAPRNREDEDGR